MEYTYANNLHGHAHSFPANLFWKYWIYLLLTFIMTYETAHTSHSCTFRYNSDKLQNVGHDVSFNACKMLLK